MYNKYGLLDDEKMDSDTWFYLILFTHYEYMMYNKYGLLDDEKMDSDTWFYLILFTHYEYFYSVEHTWPTG